jgi:hypothetical protein
MSKLAEERAIAANQWQEWEEQMQAERDTHSYLQAEVELGQAKFDAAEEVILSMNQRVDQLSAWLVDVPATQKAKTRKAA